MSDSQEQAIEARLGALLAACGPAPDPTFTARTMALVEADRRFAAARRRAWRRFGIEALAALAAVLVLLALGTASGEQGGWVIGPGLVTALAMFALIASSPAPSARS